MNFVSTKNNKGFSLIEMLLVLGVLAVLLVAAFVVYPRVRDASRANNEVTNLTAIKASINNLYATKGGNYENLNTLTANRARAFPTSMNGGDFTIGAATSIKSSWGGNVNVAANGAVADPTIAANRSFNVVYSDVPEGVCLGLVSGAAGNFSKIQVGSTQVIVQKTSGTGPTQTTSGAFQFDPAVAAGACTGSTTVTFTSV